MRIKEEQMRKVRSLFYRLMLVALIGISGYILYRSIFQINSTVTNLNIYSDVMKTSDMKPVILILGIIVYVICLVQLYRLFSKTYFNDRHTWMFGVAITILFFAALFWFCHYVTVNPTYDLSHIKRTIYASMTGDNELNNSHYYKRYPNNIALLVVVKGVMEIARALGVEDLSVVGTTLGSFTLAVTAFLCFLTAKKLRGNNMALLVLIIFVTNPLFYLYSSYYYTDVLSMPFAVFAVYMFVNFWKSEQRVMDYLSLLGAGGAIGIGYKIRATVIIVFAAIMVWTFTRVRIIKTIKVVAVIVVGMLPAVLGFKALYTMNIVEMDRNAQFPVTHWLMMGLNGESYGKYNMKDFNSTNACKTYEEKVAFNKEEIVRRVKEKGISGLYTHSKEKLAIVWSDGYGIPSTFKYVESYNKVYDYTIGTRSIFTRYYAQICRGSLFFLLCVHLVNLVRKREAEISMLEIALLGAYVFYLLWEANERYSVSFLPWMLLIMIEGVRLIELGSRKEIIEYKGRVWKLHSKVFHGVLASIVMAVSVFFMISNQSMYTKEVSKYTDDAYVLPIGQIKKRGIQVGKQELSQSFSTDRAFNQITLEVDNKKVKSSTNYMLSLYEGDKVIRRIAFSSDQIKKRKNLVLDFDTVSPNGDTIYTFCITSADATKGDAVSLIASYHCDSIKQKTFRIDGEKQNINLAFSVSNCEEATYSSKGFYWGICLLILLIEAVGFGTLFLRRRS